MSSHTDHPAPTTAHQVTDPVCGMAVDPTSAEHTASHDGETYYFCSAHCKAKFEAGPEKYAGAEAGAAVRTAPLVVGRRLARRQGRGEGHLVDGRGK